MLSKVILVAVVPVLSFNRSLVLTVVATLKWKNNNVNRCAVYKLSHGDKEKLCCLKGGQVLIV